MIKLQFFLLHCWRLIAVETQTEMMIMKIKRFLPQVRTFRPICEWFRKEPQRSIYCRRRKSEAPSYINMSHPWIEPKRIYLVRKKNKHISEKYAKIPSQLLEKLQNDFHAPENCCLFTANSKHLHNTQTTISPFISSTAEFLPIFKTNSIQIFRVKLFFRFYLWTFFESWIFSSLALNRFYFYGGKNMCTWNIHVTYAANLDRERYVCTRCFFYHYFKSHFNDVLFIPFLCFFTAFSIFVQSNAICIALIYAQIQPCAFAFFRAQNRESTKDRVFLRRTGTKNKYSVLNAELNWFNESYDDVRKPFCTWGKKPRN